MPKIYVKKLLRYPLLYQDIIQDLIDERKVDAKDETDYIVQAIEDKLLKDYGSLEPLGKPFEGGLEDMPLYLED